MLSYKMVIRSPNSRPKDAATRLSLGLPAPLEAFNRSLNVICDREGPALRAAIEVQRGSLSNPHKTAPAR